MSGREMVTWERRDGDRIGDYDFVTSTDWFDGWDEPAELIRRRWVCVEEEAGTFYPSCPTLCGLCWGEGEIPGDAGGEPVECPECHGTGDHPMRGDGWVVES